MCIYIYMYTYICIICIFIVCVCLRVDRWSREGLQGTYHFFNQNAVRERGCMAHVISVITMQFVRGVAWHTSSL